MMSSQLPTKEQFRLHTTKRPVERIDKSFASDLRRLAGAPGKYFAGAPGRSMSGNLPGVCAKGESVDDKTSPAHNPVVRKLFYPTSLSIRIPDNNRIPTVNVDYNNFSTFKVGSDSTPTPYLLFLPAHNTGLFVSGGILSVNGTTRFLPHSTLPNSRDLSSYTYARNIASRVGVKSGTISSTNVALAGTFNACAFFTLRDFKAFDVSEFSTRCISTCDYVQGVRSDNGVALVAGPEMIPGLRTITTSELYSNVDSLNLVTTYTGPLPTSWKTFTLYDYFTNEAEAFGPIIPDRTLTLSVSSDSVTSSGASGVAVYIALEITYSKLSNTGTRVDNVVKQSHALNGASDTDNVSFCATFLVTPPTPVLAWITKLVFWIYIGTANSKTPLMTVRVNVPQQYQIGNLGPGFMVACIGFNSGQEVVCDISRSIEAVPAGSLLPDKKADMTGYTLTKAKNLEHAIIGFNTPGMPIRRVYTRSDFFLYTTSIAGLHGPSHIANADLSSFNSEDRLMAGPLSSIIGGLSPFLGLIPGIGPMASAVGSAVGGLANSFGFSGPSLNSRRREEIEIVEIEEEDEEPLLPTSNPADVDMGDYTSSDLAYFQSSQDIYSDGLPVSGFAINFSEIGNLTVPGCDIAFDPTEHIPMNQLTLAEALDLAGNQLSAIKTGQRYALALMGAPVLTEPITMANVVGINSSGIASLEVIIISDNPVQSYDSNELSYDTPYRHVTIYSKNPKIDDIASFYVSEDFQPAPGTNSTQDALMVIGCALVYSGRGKARGTQYVTLPRPGIAAGPSLGISACIACLGIIDCENTFSGGFILDDGLPALTDISGTLAKAMEITKKGMALICTREDSITAMLNNSVERADGTIAHPYVSADCMPAGVPVNETRAIVVDTILEALSVGQTLTSYKNILKETPEAMTKRNAAKEQAKSSRVRKEAEMRQAGKMLLPETLAAYYNIPTEPTIEQVSNIDLAEDMEPAILSLKTMVAQENARNNLKRTLDKLAKGDFLGAFNGLSSIASTLQSHRKKGTSTNTTGFPGQSLGSLLSGRLKRKAAPKSGPVTTTTLTTTPAVFGASKSRAAVEPMEASTSSNAFGSKNRKVVQTGDLHKVAKAPTKPQGGFGLSNLLSWTGKAAPSSDANA